MAENLAESGPRGGKLRSAVLLAAALLLGLYFALPGLNHEIWYDEAYTIEYYTGQGLVYPFTHYDAPNNHPLFSSLLSFWIERVLGEHGSLPVLRLLPLLFFLAAGAALFAAGLEYGVAAATLATALFATSHVALGFATELRGYGPSWLPVIAALPLVRRYSATRQLRYLAGYCVCGVAAAAFLPTNALFFGIYGLWGAWRLRVGGKPCLKAALPLLLLPPASLLVYAGIFREVLEKAESGWHNESVCGIFSEWYGSVFGDCLWLLPFFVGGVCLALARRGKADGASERRERELLPLLALLLILPPFAYALLPHPPFPRNLVPALPVFLLIFAAFVAAAAERLARRREWLTRALPTALIVALCANAFRVERADGWYAEARGHGERLQGLYHQFYQHEYYPAKVFALAVEQAGGRQIVVLTDDSDFMGLKFARGQSAHYYVALVFATKPKALAGACQLGPQAAYFVVACSRARLEDIAAKFCERCSGYRFADETSDLGFFLVRRLVRE